jgi:hypothetical protein
MTETEYWNDYSLTRHEIVAATEAFYTYIEIHNFMAENKALYRRMNSYPTFWIIQLNALQTTFFITLSRIFDNGKDAHSIHKLLTATVAHPEFFSRAALGWRRSDGDDEPEWLHAYLAEAFEPQTADLRALKKSVSAPRATYDRAYSDLRNHVFAHKILKDQAQITELFGRTKIGDIDEMLYCLNDTIEVLGELFRNGRKPQLGVRTYHYRTRIKNATRGALQQLLVSSPKQEA